MKFKKIHEKFRLFFFNFIQRIMNKAVVFILTIFCVCSFYGQMGAFSMIKHPMKLEFQLTQTYLGLLQSLCQLGNVIGNAYLIFLPFRKPKRDFFIATVIKCIAMVGLIMGKYLGEQRKILFCVLMFIAGIMKAPVFCPCLIMNKYFDSKKQQFWVNFWYALSALGDVLTVLLGHLLMNKLGWDWSSYLLLCCGVLFIFSLLSEILLEEVPNNLPAYGNFVDQVKENYNQVKTLLSQKKYILITIDFTLIENLYYNILMWYPYYFSAVSLNQYAAYISILFPFCCLLGQFFFQFFITYCSNVTNQVILVMLGLQVLDYFCLLSVSYLQQTKELLISYFLFTAISGVLIGGPYTRVSMSQSMEATRGNSTTLYFLFAVYNFTRCLFSTVFLFVIGYCIERSYSSFFAILLLNALMIFVFGIYRRKYMIETEHSHKPEINEQMIQLLEK